MTATLSARQALLDAVTAALPLVRSTADEGERERRMPLELARVLAAAGVNRTTVPRAVGGLEVDPITYMEVIELISQADGSAGWVACVNSGAAGGVGFLPPHVGAAIGAEDPTFTFGGNQSMPRGKAIVVDGGYRLTGRWPFCSGSQHASWLGCNSIVYDGSEPRRYPDGAPVQRMMVFPASSATYLDTWYSGGLKGSGSLDVEVTDLFVPAAYSYWWAEPQHPGPLYTGRWFLLSHAGHALGLARAAIDALMELAQTKVPARSQALLRDRPLAQRQVAEADVLVGSARSYCWETVQQVWDRVSAGEPLSRLYQARVRLANTYAVTASARAVDLMYSAAGGSAVYATHPLDRIFRDIHTATQHSLVAEHTYETIGQVLLHPDPESLPLPGNIQLF